MAMLAFVHQALLATIANSLTKSKRTFALSNHHANMANARQTVKGNLSPFCINFALNQISNEFKDTNVRAIRIGPERTAICSTFVLARHVTIGAFAYQLKKRDMFAHASKATRDPSTAFYNI
jgi:hypothetical protein